MFQVAPGESSFSMASYKIRRLTRPTGGITVGNFNVDTGGNVTIGTTGTELTKLICGSGVVTAISCGAASSGSATITVPNLATSDLVFVMASSTAACTFIMGACATAASVLTIKFQNSGSAASADQPWTVQYLALRNQ